MQDGDYLKFNNYFSWNRNKDPLSAQKKHWEETSSIDMLFEKFCLKENRKTDLGSFNFLMK